MSFYIPDAAAFGLKEALKLLVLWTVVRAFLAQSGRLELGKYFFAAILASLGFLFAPLFIEYSQEVLVLLGRFKGYIFFLFLFVSIVTLFKSMRKTILLPRAMAGAIVLFGFTFLYLSSEVLGIGMFAHELALMRGNAVAVYGSMLFGFTVTFILGLFMVPVVSLRIAPYLAAGQTLLLLSLIKFLGSSGGLAEVSLVHAVQGGTMKFVHDLVHQIFVFLMVPDHPMLTITTWDFIAIFFGSNFGLFAALIILIGPPLVWMFIHLTETEKVSDGAASGAERRLHRAEVRSDRRRKALPVAVFALSILMVWYVGLSSDVSSLHLPTPKPVVEDNGFVVIPLKDPTMDLMDGGLYKFSLLTGGETIDLMVLRRSDGRLTVSLDACEICPPDGYGLSGNTVVCVYCSTPIPIDSLGKPGGCNPIPLEASISDSEIRIDVQEIKRKWQSVTTGELKEGIR
jgi:uncharacterized membrane protein